MEMTSLRQTNIAAAVVLLAGMLAACSPSPSGERHGNSAVPSKAVVAFGNRIERLDPDQAVGLAETDVLHLIGGNLFESRGHAQVVPGLAATTTIAPDGLSWTFVLRSGASFSDGTPLTSVDVKATQHTGLP